MLSWLALDVFGAFATGCCVEAGVAYAEEILGDLLRLRGSAADADADGGAVEVGLAESMVGGCHMRRSGALTDGEVERHSGNGRGLANTRRHRKRKVRDGVNEKATARGQATTSRRAGRSAGSGSGRSWRGVAMSAVRLASRERAARGQRDSASDVRVGQASTSRRRRVQEGSGGHLPGTHAGQSSGNKVNARGSMCSAPRVRSLRFVPSSSRWPGLPPLPRHVSQLKFGLP